MKVAFITRSTLYKIHGGSTVQVIETAKELEKLGVSVRIFLAHEKINYHEFDLLHFFDLTRPANILYHAKKSGTPFVVSPILVDYSEYDRLHRRGITGLLLGAFAPEQTEFLKTIGRWLLRKDSLPSKAYIWKGQKRAIKEIIEKAALLLPNSQSEHERLSALYNIQKPYAVIPNGADMELFHTSGWEDKDDLLVICAARIEGLKNQLNLIKALNNTPYKLVLIGHPTPNQAEYNRQCQKIAAANVEFAGKLSQKELAAYYRKAKVHVLPSWFETCGLSSIEAAAMGCNIVITEKGFTRDHFGEEAFYCDPGDTNSIYNAVVQASQAPYPGTLQQLVRQKYTWQQASVKTLEAYKTIL